MNADISVYIAEIVVLVNACVTALISVGAVVDLSDTDKITAIAKVCAAIIVVRLPRGFSRRPLMSRRTSKTLLIILGTSGKSTVSFLHPTFISVGTHQASRSTPKSWARQ